MSFETHRVGAIFVLVLIVGIVLFSYVWPGQRPLAAEPTALIASLPSALPLHAPEAVSSLVPSVSTPVATATVPAVAEPLPETVVHTETPPTADGEVASARDAADPISTPVTPSPAPVPPAPVTQHIPTPAITLDATALAQAIHQRTNALRQEEGLSTLAYDASLAKNAVRYSQAMLSEGFFAHVDPEGCNMTCRFAHDGYEALAWGENLARWKSSYAPTVDEVAEYFVREWERSSGHRENILSTTYTREGVGVAISGTTVYATVHFAQPYEK